VAVKADAAVQAHGRPLAEAHLDACVRAGLTISGMNAEANPGQWEFQIGPGGPYEMPDHVMVARWLLHRIGEDMGVTVSLDPTAVSADGHGAAANTNFSTARMRRPGGMEHIEKAIVSLEKRHAVHMQEYGGGAQLGRGVSRNDSDVCPPKPPLFGSQLKCKTADLVCRTSGCQCVQAGAFRWGVADRTASVRIPRAVAIAGYGYLEDRRPSADVDPYTVARLLIETCITNAKS
jgi:glutamine synthetase